MSKKKHNRFYDIVIHPADNQCPIFTEDAANCNNCEYMDYIGTFGGEYYVDCTYSEKQESE